MTDGSASADKDAASYALGSTYYYNHVMGLFLRGELEELETPAPGAIALYFNLEDDVIHVGKVIEAETGLLVISSLEGRLSPFVSYTSEFPLDEIVRVSWVQPPPSQP